MPIVHIIMKEAGDRFGQSKPGRLGDRCTGDLRVGFDLGPYSNYLCEQRFELAPLRWSLFCLEYLPETWRNPLSQADTTDNDEGSDSFRVPKSKLLREGGAKGVDNKTGLLISFLVNDGKQIIRHPW